VQSLAPAVRTFVLHPDTMRKVTTVPDNALRQPFRVLCVCTGNVYRSRIAEAELRRELLVRLGPDSDHFLIVSAGTDAVTGRPLSSAYVADLDRLGVDTGSAVTRRLEATEILGADLVLGAERVHRKAVLELAPAALRRTFTFRELARIGRQAVERAEVAGPSGDLDPVARAHRVVASASRVRGLEPAAHVGDDDIADPWNGPEAALELAARQVREAVSRVVDVLIGDRSAVRGRE
jgi:protein-tyrosine phosphatase